ncbi:MAG: metal-dependent hydrolase [Lysobacteraceae bacterium]|nr:MAG: metal-dependent hydrolase [Xanthomonadaceae bacterium]
MSSFLGHAAVGAATYLARHRLNDRQALPALPVCVLVAICADFDYLGIWWFGAHAAARFTHALPFACIIAVVVWMMMRSLPWTSAARMPFVAWLIAAASHPLLDLAVGAHPLPLFWPFTDSGVSSPIGVLPSAGRLDIANVYLWRNLLLEIGVLLPILASVVVVSREGASRRFWRAAAVIAPVWIACLVCAVGLQR